MFSRQGDARPGSFVVDYLHSGANDKVAEVVWVLTEGASHACFRDTNSGETEANHRREPASEINRPGRHSVFSCNRCIGRKRVVEIAGSYCGCLRDFWSRCVLPVRLFLLAAGRTRSTRQKKRKSPTPVVEFGTHFGGYREYRLECMAHRSNV